MELAGRMRTTCARFLPKDNTPEDPVYKVDEHVTIMTYLSSRTTGRTENRQAVNGNKGLMS